MEYSKNGMPIYFANLKSEEIGQALVGKLEKFNEGFSQHRYYDTIDRSYRLYYGLDHENQTGTKGLGQAGRRGELTRIKVNKYRSNIQHLLSLLTQQRPAFDCSSQFRPRKLNSSRIRK